MKQVVFTGNALAYLRDFPPGARQDAGFQIDKIQRGEPPDDWKPMRSIGQSVREIRINEKGGQFRIVYVVGRVGLAWCMCCTLSKRKRGKRGNLTLTSPERG